MRQRTEAELLQIRRLTIWANIALLAIGVVLLGLYFVLHRSRPSQDVGAVVYLVGDVLVSTSLVSLLVGRVSSLATSIQVTRSVEQAVDELLHPLAEDVFASSQRDFHWSCLLASPMAAPDLASRAADDSVARLVVESYLVQYLEISKKIRFSLSTRELRFACLASADDAALPENTRSTTYLMRWIVEPELQPLSPTLFSVADLYIDGRPIGLTRRGNADGTRIEYVARLAPDVDRDVWHQCQWRARVLKYAGSDRRIAVKVQLFALTVGASFRLAVDSSVPLSGLTVRASEVTPLGGTKLAGQRELSEDVEPFPGWWLSTSTDGALQAGSVVSFEVSRELGVPGSAGAPRASG